MAERKTGFYSLLKYAPIYETTQRLMGAKVLREQFVESYVKPRPGDRVLDIGCGAGPYLAHMPEVDYFGWDPNSNYIAQARGIYGDRGTFRVGLFGREQAEQLGPIDIAIVSAVLHHMTDAEATELFGLLRGVLKPGGRVATLDNVFVEGQNPVARLLISLDRGRHVRTAQGYQALAKRNFTQVTGNVVVKKFPPYTYFFMTAQ